MLLLLLLLCLDHDMFCQSILSASARTWPRKPGGDQGRQGRLAGRYSVGAHIALRVLNLVLMS